MLLKMRMEIFWAPGRAIRLYGAGIRREAGIHCYPWRVVWTMIFIIENENYDFIIALSKCRVETRRYNTSRAYRSKHRREA